MTLADLPWLPLPPSDHRDRMAAFRRSDRPTDHDLKRLANCRLDENGIISLGKVVRAVADRIDLSSGLTKVRMVLLSDTTTDYLAPALVASAVRRGILLDLVVGDFGLIEQELFDPKPEFLDPAPDLVMVSIDTRMQGLDAGLIDEGAAERAVAAARARVQAIADLAKAKLNAPVLWQTLAVPPDPWVGSVDRRLPGSPARMIGAVNAKIADVAEGNLLLDADALASAVGRDAWFDAGLWHSAKVPFALDFLPLYADHVARLLAALKGRTGKCLVLDLDNTLWGGVVGDDGLDGIAIGQGSAAGEAHLALQRYALQCRDRGIVLAVCSKNEEDVAWGPFRTHQDMVLREAHIAVFRANWDDKASNLQHIATTLNIGVDSLVFVDDNPAERARVRQMLPDVAVPELSDDPASYVRVLAGAGYFDSLGLSAEDRGRADFYQANASRLEMQEKMGDMEGYLASLQMRMVAIPFDPANRARIAQLINKSNQYNLTTRRYSEAQVARLEGDPGAYTLTLRLTDRFGDNGLISVVVFNRGASAWECDTWLMSCRVLGRRVEEAALAEVAAAAKASGATALIGRYVPSAKNKMVKGHFEKLGFAPLDAAPDGSTSWSLALDAYVPPALPIDVVRS